MPTFKKCDPTVREMAVALMNEIEPHKPLLDVKLDLMFAFPDFDDETGEPINDALKWNGVPALGVAKIINLKDRAKGLGDAEICLDGFWWENHDEGEQRALLDHELTHLILTKKTDDLGRPKLKLKKHDVTFGWFASVAQRHGVHSQEVKQAKSCFDVYGQFFFPEIAAHLKESSRPQMLEMNARG